MTRYQQHFSSNVTKSLLTEMNFFVYSNKFQIKHETVVEDSLYFLSAKPVSFHDKKETVGTLELLLSCSEGKQTLAKTELFYFLVTTLSEEYRFGMTVTRTRFGFPYMRASSWQNLFEVIASLYVAFFYSPDRKPLTASFVSFASIVLQGPLLENAVLFRLALGFSFRQPFTFSDSATNVSVLRKLQKEVTDAPFQLLHFSLYYKNVLLFEHSRNFDLATLSLLVGSQKASAFFSSTQFVLFEHHTATFDVRAVGKAAETTLSQIAGFFTDTLAPTLLGLCVPKKDTAQVFVSNKNVLFLNSNLFALENCSRVHRFLKLFGKQTAEEEFEHNCSLRQGFLVKKVPELDKTLFIFLNDVFESEIQTVYLNALKLLLRN